MPYKDKKKRYELTKRWAGQNPRKVKEIEKRYVRKLKHRVFNLLGRACNVCGSVDQRVLQIDHRWNDGAEDRKNGYTYKKLYLDVLKHPEKYQTLCANCNWIKEYELRKNRPIEK